MLNKIISKQKEDMQQREAMLPLTSILDNVQKSNRDFHAALLQHSPAFIFECKHRSPSEGTLVQEYPITTLAQKYAQFADAISVLTNEPFFGGSYSHLRRVSDAIDKPVLCKDIIINPYQVATARLYGADAVLLMLSVLNDVEYSACAQLAQNLNMDVLTEVFTEEEMRRAIKLKAKIIGINHRNLQTMQLEMDKVVKLAPLCPPETILIVASGIKTHQQIQALAPIVDGFLIGSSLSKSNHRDLLMRELIFGHIKICGLTQPSDIEQAYACGAVYGGLNFANNSPRKVTIEQAKDLITYAPLHYVGVFVHQAIAYICQVARELNLHAVQIHGGESMDHINELRQQLPPSCRIWYAVAADGILPQQMPESIDKIVIDKNIFLGGTGQTFDWNKIKNHPLRQYMILAGGLSPQNIAKAKSVGTWGIDVNSKIEQSPGIKDHYQLAELFLNCRKGMIEHVA